VTDGPATDPVPDRPRRGRAGLRRVGRILRRTGYVVVALAVLLVSGLLPFQTIRIPSDSMTPTVAPGDHLLLDKRHPADVAVGDVVVVHDPLADGDADSLIVKRVIAVGGDSVGFEDGILVRNGLPVTEPYTADFLDGVYYGPDVVPPGMLYLLGDNRLDSIDSRHFGPVPVSAVVGHIDARLFPSPGPLPHGV
jgi:signal peptidase I